MGTPATFGRPCGPFARILPFPCPKRRVKGVQSPRDSTRRRFVTGVAPSLQNWRQAARSAVGSTPMRLRQINLSSGHCPDRIFQGPPIWAALFVVFKQALAFRREGVSRGQERERIPPRPLWLSERCSRPGPGPCPWPERPGGWSRRLWRRAPCRTRARIP